MKAVPWILAAVAIPCVVLLLEPWHACGRHAAFTTTSLTRTWCRSGERNASATLKTVASAQADYRGNDRDGNGIQDFWRGDVSGLYGVVAAGSTEMIKLIEISTAGSDVSPSGTLPLGEAGPGQVHRKDYTSHAPKAGYWFRALRHADEDPAALSPNRFAACAYPADYPRNRKTYIIDEGNTILARDLGRPGPPDVYPDPETLKRDWSKLD